MPLRLEFRRGIISAIDVERNVRLLACRDIDDKLRQLGGIAWALGGALAIGISLRHNAPRASTVPIANRPITQCCAGTIALLADMDWPPMDQRSRRLPEQRRVRPCQPFQSRLEVMIVRLVQAASTPYRLSRRFPISAMKGDAP
jgi:hypothetical protein